MNRSGYDVRLAAGTITAGGTLGILIPPSIMLVVMGPVLEIPVIDLFAAAIIPGIMLASLYAGYAMIRCWMNPNLGPILPEDQQPVTSKLYWLEAIIVIGSILALFTFMVMGLSGSFSGLFPFANLIVPAAWGAVMIYGSRWVESTSLLVSSSLTCGMNFLWVWCRRQRGGFRSWLNPVWLGYTNRRCGLWCIWCIITDTGLWPVYLGRVLSGTTQDARDFSAYPVSGGGIKFLRGSVLASWYANLADRIFAVMGYVFYHDFDHYHGDDLPSWLAAGMGAYCADYRAYSYSCAGEAGYQSDMVWHSGCGKSSDGVAQSACRALGLFP